MVQCDQCKWFATVQVMEFGERRLLCVSCFNNYMKCKRCGASTGDDPRRSIHTDWQIFCRSCHLTVIEETFRQAEAEGYIYKTGEKVCGQDVYAATPKLMQLDDKVGS